MLFMENFMFMIAYGILMILRMESIFLLIKKRKIDQNQALKKRIK